jgi:hypothetical protein
MKYLTMIRAIALLHQHQREIKTRMEEGVKVEYIEAALEDIATANRLAHEVLGRSLDELSPQTRRFLLLLDEMVTKECKRLAMDRSDYRFRRKDVRDSAGWTDFQVRTHIDKLVSLEYVLVHRGSRGQNFVYELLYDGQGKDGSLHLMGLIDVEKLETYGYDKKFEGGEARFEHQKEKFEGSTSIQSASIEPPTSMDDIALQAPSEAALPGSDAKPAEKALIGKSEKKRSYVVVPACRTDGSAPVEVLPLVAVPAVAPAVIPAAARPAAAASRPA